MTLLVASYCGRPEITALLLAMGADPKIRNLDNLTPVEVTKG
ncbi:ankyrin repeat domain-containing protein [Patescibacteria group bacterium]|nr:ankyrin repeat domain-containing protein [Patescibacteria group bacterium]